MSLPKKTTHSPGQDFVAGLVTLAVAVPDSKVIRRAVLVTELGYGLDPRQESTT